MLTEVINMLTDRQLLILQVIVDDFIQSAQPVGSRSLSKKDSILLSSATIRNEMSDLEELGFIEKTHSSSGRVPSDKGYRYYVDHLLSPRSLKEDEVKKVQSIFDERMIEIEKIVQKSTSILSELTNYTVFALGPTVRENKLKKIQIIPVSNQTAVAIIVTDTGHVQNQMFALPEQIDASDLERLANILNDRLIGVPIVQLKEKIYMELANLIQQHIANYDALIKSFTTTLDLNSKEKIYHSGYTNMFAQPEFADINKVRLLMNIMEQENHLYELIRPNQTGLTVSIGKENNNRAFEDCTLITATYDVGNNQQGTIAILGPTRMEYQKVISIVDYVTKDLSRILTKLYK